MQFLHGGIPPETPSIIGRKRPQKVSFSGARMTNSDLARGLLFKRDMAMSISDGG